jgi:hypothetical protein
MEQNQPFENFIREHFVLIDKLMEKTQNLFDNQLSYIRSHFQKTVPYFSQKDKATELMVKGENLTDDERVKIAETIFQYTDTYRKSLIQPLQAINKEIEAHLLVFESELKAVVEFEEKFRNIPEDRKQKAINVIKRLIDLLSIWKKQFSNRLLATSSIIKYVESDEMFPALTLAHGGKKDIQLTDEEKKAFANNMAEYHSRGIVAWEEEKKLDEECKKLLKELPKIK